MFWLCNQHLQAKFESLSFVIIFCSFSCSFFFTFCLNSHLPNCMHPAHYISIIMHFAHSTLFQLTWQWWKCCLNELGAHKFYFCPFVKVDSSIWFFSSCLSVLIWMPCTAFWRAFLCTTLAINLFSLSLSFSLSMEMYIYIWNKENTPWNVYTALYFVLFS